MNDSLYESAKDQINVGIISHIYPPGGKKIQSRRDIIQILRSNEYATLTFSDKDGRELYTWVCKPDDVPALESWIKHDPDLGFHGAVVIHVKVIDPWFGSSYYLRKKERTVTEWVRG